MKKSNSVLQAEAWQTLSGKWGLAVGTFLLYFIILFAVEGIPKAGGLLSLLIGGPLGLGVAIFSLALSRNQGPSFDQLFQGFEKPGRPLLAYLLMVLFIVLWTLLLIVPGIIATISYSMMFFILVDNPNIGPREAIRMSKKMMYGYKWKFFCLNLRFVGWALLCVLTLGIGFFWLIPYMQISAAKFYEDLKSGGEAVTTDTEHFKS